MEINLIQLPDHVLEKIFCFCFKKYYDPMHLDESWGMKKLMECNKYLKDFIENNSRIMDQLSLKVTIDEEPIKSYREILEICLASSRKYRTIRLYIFDFGKFRKLERHNQVNFKALIDKYGSEIREVFFDLVFDYQESIEEYVENLKNVEKIEIVVNWGHFMFERRTSIDFEGELLCIKTPVPLYFDKLKELRINIVEEVGQVKFDIFTDCKNLQKLKLGLECEFHVASLGCLLTSCRAKLQDLNVQLTAVRLNNQFAQFFEMLLNINLDLKSFKCTYDDSAGTEEIDFLKIFIESQTNLEKLELFVKANEYVIVNMIADLLGSLHALKTLSLHINCADVEEFAWKYWNICNLESLSVNHNTWFEARNLLAENVLQHPNENLKELQIGLDFQNNAISKMISNYRSLTRLSINKGSLNFESNDIFEIMKHLKLLEYLQFHFPENSQLSVDLLKSNEDLVLPKIKEINFQLNSLITSDILMQFTKYIQHASKFEIGSSEKFDHRAGLDGLTKQLPNLKRLHLLGFCCSEIFDQTYLQQIESNLRQFNNHTPFSFFLNYRSIEQWKGLLTKN